MEENLNIEATRFEIKVPYNDPLLVTERKKSGLLSGIGSMIFAAILLAIMVVAILNNYDVWMLVVFGGFGAVMMVCGIYFLTLTKPKGKNNDITFDYFFYEDYLKVKQNNGKVSSKKDKTLKNCLYRDYKNKQYIAEVYEFENRFQIKIYTGTYNFVPQYQFHTIPKSTFENNEQLAAFIEFIKSKVEPDYKVKTEKQSKITK